MKVVTFYYYINYINAITGKTVEFFDKQPLKNDNLMNSHNSPGRGSTGSSNGRRGKKSAAVNDVSERFSHFTMECSSQLNKCASWLCKRTTSGNLNERQRSPSADMIHHSANFNSSPVATSGIEDDSQPPARNCYRLIVLG